MDVRLNMNKPELTAVLIAPDREMAAEFMSTLLQSHAFQVISELKTYPCQETLATLLRQARPDVVVVDVGSDTAAAGEVIRSVIQCGQSIQVVGLHRRNDSEVLLCSLRAGATEFLHSPFEIATQHEAAARLRRLRQPISPVSSQPGTVAVFSSAKPGSGASTLATQTALELSRNNDKRVLLADFDLCRGMIGFFLKVSHPASIVDVLKNSHQLTPGLWSTFVAQRSGLDVLCAPELPYAGPIDSESLPAVMDYARNNYDSVIVDLPVIFQRLSLMTLPNSDGAFLVTTAELPSLHLARKAIRLLEHLGFPNDRFQVVVNRTNKRSDLGSSEIEKLFNCTVHSRIPNDFSSVNRAISHGEPIDAKCDAGKAIASLASRLAHKVAEPKLKATASESPSKPGPSR